MPYRPGLTALAALLGLAQEPAAEAILSPADQSTVAVGSVRLIARGAGLLLVDGKMVASEQPAPGVVSAVVALAAGTHQIAMGARKIRVHAGGGAPGDWKPYQAHPPSATGCDTCHAVKDGAWAMRRASLAPICFTCHDRGKFPATHTHNTDILADCQSCHDPHGSTGKAHLRMSRERACKQCHA